MALFETKNLTFSYPLSDKTALKNVDLKVEQGEFILVMGKSGSGKSTFLRLLKKEIAPVGKIGGEININCDSIGFVGQNPETSFVCDNVRSELAFSPPESSSIFLSRRKFRLKNEAVSPILTVISSFEYFSFSSAKASSERTLSQTNDVSSPA